MQHNQPRYLECVLRLRFGMCNIVGYWKRKGKFLESIFEKEKLWEIKFIKNVILGIQAKRGSELGFSKFSFLKNTIQQLQPTKSSNNN